MERIAVVHADEQENQDRRRDLRFPCDTSAVEVHLDARDQPLTAHVIEVSRAGLKLRMDDALPVGTPLTVEVGKLSVLGEVRRCESGPDASHTVGVLLFEAEK